MQDAHDQHPPADDPPSSSSPGRWRRRAPWLAGLGVGLIVVAWVAIGVFGVHRLFYDDTVDEAGPTFRSGATLPADPSSSTDDDVSTPDPAATDGTMSDDPGAEPAEPVVREVGRGTFEGRDHPGEGTAVVLTDGDQTFVRFEDDFETDNGPDLYAVIYVDGERVELEKLKGNRGSQNYEVPATIAADDIEGVAVWCKRFDSTFTEAALT